MIQTLAIDFDGVIHGYSKGWQDGSIYDKPKPGAKEALQEFLDNGWEVVIWSTRCNDRTVNGVSQNNQISEMVDWLAKYQIPYSRIHCSEGKPLCKLFIDDNAYRFISWQDIDLHNLISKLRS